MKSSLLITIFFVASTAWATQKFPWVFAKFNNTYVPLSGKYLGERFGNRSSFTYGYPSAKPVEFSLQHNYAFTVQNGELQYVGFYQDNLMFGRTIAPEPLVLDGEGRSGSGPFYLCDMMGDPPHGVLHGMSAMGVSYCFKVDIYILPYNRNTKSAVLRDADGNLPEEVEKSLYVVEEPCSLTYYGNNAHKELEEFVRTYDGECNINIYEEAVPKPPKVSVYQPRKSCTFRFQGKNAHQHHAQFIKAYDGKCDIYVDEEVMPKPSTVAEYGSTNPCAYHFHGKNSRANNAQFIKSYNGKCELYVDGQLVPKTRRND